MRAEQQICKGASSMIRLSCTARQIVPDNASLDAANEVFPGIVVLFLDLTLVCVEIGSKSSHILIVHLEGMSWRLVR